MNFTRQDLITDLKDELSGSFEDLIVALVKPLTEFLASAVHKAIRDMHLKTQEKTLVEILYTRSNADIIAIKDAYEKCKLLLISNAIAYNIFDVFPSGEGLLLEQNVWRQIHIQGAK